jgi:hypothetical protein
MAARELGNLLGEPGLELGHQRRAELMPDREPFGGSLAIDAALDVEDGIQTLHGFEPNRIMQEIPAERNSELQSLTTPRFISTTPD